MFLHIFTKVFKNKKLPKFSTIQLITFWKTIYPQRLSLNYHEVWNEVVTSAFK